MVPSASKPKFRLDNPVPQSGQVSYPKLDFRFQGVSSLTSLHGNGLFSFPFSG